MPCGDPLAIVARRSASNAGRLPAVPAPRRRSRASRAIGAYDGSLRAIVHAFKYDGCRSLAQAAGRALRERAADLLADADIVVPVPLHRTPAAGAGLQPGARARPPSGRAVVDALRRARATPSQTDLPAAARHAQRARRVRARGAAPWYS